MRTLTCTKPGELNYITAEKPFLEKDSAIIRIRRIGICGTDLHAFEGTQPFFSYPRILGHELSGELVDFDNAPGFQKGEAVTFIPYFSCGSCIACRRGKPNCCQTIRVCGVHSDGGMAEYLLVPSWTLLHGSRLSFDELALIEPLAIGAHGVRRANVEKGEYVLVIGAGPIGLGVMEFAGIAGAKVIALDINEQRLAFCKENTIADTVVSGLSAGIQDQLYEITGGDMPTVIIDATGNRTAINNAFQYLAHGGRYVLVGLQKNDISFSHPEFHKREATLMSSRNATKEDFEYVIDCMKNSLVNPMTYITHRVDFSDVKDKFATWLDPAEGVIKAMVSIE